MASVLLVEDEALIQMMIANMLAELGHSVVAKAGDLVSFPERASTVNFEFAVLDVLLGRTSSEPVPKSSLDATSRSFSRAGMLSTQYLPDFRSDRSSPNLFK
ncbi:response regulator [Bradyrhizobium sp. 35]|uniref:response regulator n=1 Tax=Bradyrhizobium sp. 35 TaxID=2782670 RepID=UPI001FFA69F3|nr:response regulator [Bradyrhizobium sp. 35]MCK1455175.1 response regulator [Bradyrhizobium sp. 35]